ncbi:MFS transporter [Candidatus Dependentiae bacterium]|nr:MFS transporter [Candidatus Dependentiae bacterium]
MKKMKNIYLLGITSFLNDLSSEMILPLLPALITHTGGTGLALGLIGGLRDSASELMKAFFGIASDRYKTRKPFIYAGYLVTGMLKFFFPLAETWQAIFVMVGIERIGKGLRTAPRDAIIAQTASDQKGRSFGIHRCFDTAGAIAGSVIALALITAGSTISFHSICIAAGVISILAVVPLFWVQEQLPAYADESDVSFVGMADALKIIRVPTAIAALFSLGSLSYMFLIAYASEVLAGSACGPTMPVALYVLYNIIYTLVAMPAGIISDKISHGYGLSIGYGMFALGMFCFALLQPSIVVLVIGFGCYSLAKAFIDVNHKALVAQLTPTRFQASALGIFDTITGLCTLLAGLVCGLLWDHVSHQGMFLYAAVVTVAAAVLLVVYKRSVRRG